MENRNLVIVSTPWASLEFCAEQVAVDLKGGLLFQVCWEPVPPARPEAAPHSGRQRELAWRPSTPGLSKGTFSSGFCSDLCP